MEEDFTVGLNNPECRYQICVLLSPNRLYRSLFACTACIYESGQKRTVQAYIRPYALVVLAGGNETITLIIGSSSAVSLRPPPLLPTTLSLYLGFLRERGRKQLVGLRQVQLWR